MLSKQISFNFFFSLYRQAFWQNFKILPLSPKPMYFKTCFRRYYMPCAFLIGLLYPVFIISYVNSLGFVFNSVKKKKYRDRKFVYRSKQFSGQFTFNSLNSVCFWFVKEIDVNWWTKKSFCLRFFSLTRDIVTVICRFFLTNYYT